MAEIPENYMNEVRALCRLHNRYYKSGLDPKSISMKTRLRDDLGIGNLDMVLMEDALMRRYPAAEGLAFVPGINTVGDVINYINRKLVQQ